MKLPDLTKHLPATLNAIFHTLLVIVFWLMCGLFGLILGVASLYFF